MSTIRRPLKFLLPLLAALLTACAQAPRQPDDAPRVLSYAETQTRYQQGLANYRNNRFDLALADFGAALSSNQLKSAETVTARKHLAFIHCVSNREAQCREQFLAILKIDADFNLAPNEASHPQWGPIWLSIKGAFDDQRAIARAGATQAGPAQHKLADGIRHYDAGRYKEAIDALQSAIKSVLPSHGDEIRAHKYSAFAYCLLQQRVPCRAEFHQIFALEPTFELLPSEAGHPAWAGSYRGELAAAKRGKKK